MTTFWISGKPQGKQRPRFSNGHAYTPSKTKEYEELVAWNYKLAGGTLFDGNVSIVITACFKGDGGYCAQRLDADNIAKVILDGLNGVGYNDDKQVVDLHVRKVYDSKDGVRVTVKNI